jgi:hypothetical protein
MIEQKIISILDDCGIDVDDRTEVQASKYLTGTYYTFEVYDPNVEEMFALGSGLGAEFGEDVWIDTYQKTNKLRAVAKLEVLARDKK